MELLHEKEGMNKLSKFWKVEREEKKNQLENCERDERQYL
jgi:hypothetical protein